MEDLKIRQKCEEMIAYGYVALRQFPKFNRVLSDAEVASAYTSLKAYLATRGVTVS